MHLSIDIADRERGERERWKEEDIPSPFLKEPVVASMVEGDGGDNGKAVVVVVALPVACRHSSIGRWRWGGHDSVLACVL